MLVSLHPGVSHASGHLQPEPTTASTPAINFYERCLNDVLYLSKKRKPKIQTERLKCLSTRQPSPSRRSSGRQLLSSSRLAAQTQVTTFPWVQIVNQECRQHVPHSHGLLYPRKEWAVNGSKNPSDWSQYFHRITQTSS